MEVDQVHVEMVWQERNLAVVEVQQCLIQHQARVVMVELL
jgi:hypothetical protein